MCSVTVSSTAVPAIPGLLLFRDFISVDEEQRLLHAIETGPWETGGIARRVQHYGAKFDYVTLAAPSSGTGDFPSTPVTSDVSSASAGSSIDSSAPAHAITGPIAEVCAKVGRLRAVTDSSDGYSRVDARVLDYASHTATAMASFVDVGTGGFVPVPNQVTVNEYIPGGCMGGPLTHCACMAQQPPHPPTHRGDCSDAHIMCTHPEAGQGISPHVDTHSPFGHFIFSVSLASGRPNSCTHAHTHTLTHCVVAPPSAGHC